MLKNAVMQTKTISTKVWSSISNGTANFSFSSINLGSSGLVTRELANSQQLVSNADDDRIVVSQEKDYAPARMGSFTQCAPMLHNPYVANPLMRRFLQRTVTDKELFARIDADLHSFGEIVVNEIEPLGRECEHDQPSLQSYSAFGNRTDTLHTSFAWKEQKRLSADHGLIHIGYHHQHSFARLHQYIKLCLYAPSSGLFSCPLAMTDGAAKVIKELDLHSATGDTFDRLTTTVSERFWTSGQWMTEKAGGSDVAGGTDTRAVLQPNGSYRLYGHKWFSSASDADVSLTLARIVSDNGATGKVQLVDSQVRLCVTFDEGSSGLSLFFLRVRDDSGNLNQIEIVQLKNKLGTRQLPTAELLLHGTQATLISEPGRGVAGIGHMLNITRLHNSVSAVGLMQKITNLAKDYAGKRKAFGRLLRDLPLHSRTLAEMQLQTNACALITLRCVQLLDESENSSGAESERALLLLRMLTPIVKLYTAKQAVAVVSEGLESFGGLGYIEDTGLPAMFRDAQVLPIWEGTTNVLSMDVCRVMHKHPNIMQVLETDILRLMQATEHAAHPLNKCYEAVLTGLQQVQGVAIDQLQLGARDVSMQIATLYIGALFIQQANQKDSCETEIIAAKRWCTMETMRFVQTTDCYDLSEHKMNLAFTSF